jgi:type I restriction enzyme, S subunit
MASNLRIYNVADLEKAGRLRVEDGNHGEYRPRPDESTETGTSFIRAADMDSGRILFQSASRINKTALARIRKGIGSPGDVLLSSKGSVGKIALAPLNCEPFVCSPQVTFWRSLDDHFLNYQFLYYYIQSPDFRRQMVARSGESDMAPYISLTNQRQFQIAVPEIDEQKAIAHILGTLDDKIELNREMNQTLEAAALQSIMQGIAQGVQP